MKMVFHFPILHDSCESCRYRFQCMTMKIHKEYVYDVGGSGYKKIQEIIPFRFGLSCFSLTPYNRVTELKLELCYDKESMVVEAQWD